jgi:hypothetical protein
MSVNRPVEVVRGAVTAIRQQLSAVAGQSERTLLLGTILLASTVSAATGFVLAQYYSVDVLSSLLANPAEDCWLDWGTQIGRHCFGDYPWAVGVGMRPNPWEPYALFLPWHNYQADQNDYVAAGMVPQLLFGLPAKWLGTPRLGLIGYLLGLTIAVFTPAVWAARGARGLERVVVFVALGAAAIPAWTVIDRGNSVGFVTPIALVFLVALRQQRWRLVAIMVVLAALVKPQFAILAVALLAARQWRWGGLAVGGAVIANLAAYLLWPRDFPETIVQSIHNALHHGSPVKRVWLQNASFGRGIFFIPDMIETQRRGSLPSGFLDGPRSLIGYVVLVAVVGCVLALGRRIPPVMVGIALLATASLFPSLSYRYYLLFALPFAALVVRDPDGTPGSGIFDRRDVLGDRRRALGVCLSLTAALTIAQIPLPLPPIQVDIPGQLGAVGVIGTTPIVPTTADLLPVLWLIACTAIIVSYARRPATGTSADASSRSASGEPRPAASSRAIGGESICRNTAAGAD